MKTDPKARYQGYSFYFREGFCWIDVNSTYLKARLKGNGVFDVLSMTLFTMTQIPDWYYVSIINSELISLYVDNFINNTSHFQINDARQLPIVVPSEVILTSCKAIVDDAITVKKRLFMGVISPETADHLLKELQHKLDTDIVNLYMI